MDEYFDHFKRKTLVCLSRVIIRGDEITFIRSNKIQANSKWNRLSGSRCQFAVTLKHKYGVTKIDVQMRIDTAAHFKY